MGNKYDDGKYGVRSRKWFGLMAKYGGQAPNSTGGFTVSSGADGTWVTGWYPEGPIKILKIGVMNQKAGGANSRACPNIRFYSGTTQIARLAMSSATTAALTVASTTTLATDDISQKGYIAIVSATPCVVGKHASNSYSYNAVTGSYACFVDWVPKYHSSWDV